MNTLRTFWERDRFLHTLVVFDTLAIIGICFVLINRPWLGGGIIGLSTVIFFWQFICAMND